MKRKLIIFVNQEDANRTKYIAQKVWTEVTAEEKIDYQKLIEKFGVLVSLSLRNND